MSIAEFKTSDLKILSICIFILSLYAWILKTSLSDDMSPLFNEDIIWFTINIFIFIMNLGLFCYLDTYFSKKCKAPRRIIDESEDQIQSFKSTDDLTKCTILILLQLWMNLILSNMKNYEQNFMIQYFFPLFISFNLMEMIREDQFEDSPLPFQIYGTFISIYLIIIGTQNILTITLGHNFFIDIVSNQFNAITFN